MKRIPMSESPESLRRHLASGGVLAIPTESSYGLAVDPRNPAGVEAIYRIKERDRGKPLPVVAANIEQLTMLGIDTSSSEFGRVAGFWPAPLTLVIPAGGPEGSWPASGGHATLAVRIPAHDGLRQLLENVQSPLTATSANAAGEPPILDPDRLESWLNASASEPQEPSVWIVDGGTLPGGAPSTLVAWTEPGWQVIRQGRFPIKTLEAE